MLILSWGYNEPALFRYKNSYAKSTAIFSMD
jgi:hypothetical protein